MESFIAHEGLVLPLDRNNVDTDAILPKVFLKSISRTGFGAHLFDDWRYLDPYQENGDNAARRPNPAFVLNQSDYVGASILLARANFGCGSSREHAVWAFRDSGFRVLIAASFADIFFSNCFKNGIVPICLSNEQIDALFKDVASTALYRLTISLAEQKITTPSGASLYFDIDSSRKFSLLNGLDEIGLTLRHTEAIRNYEQQRRKLRPWLYPEQSTIL
jgi:3-isopropylmalate/(R)-2-methylmalate dehydratase small subunit